MYQVLNHTLVILLFTFLFCCNAKAQSYHFQDAGLNDKLPSQNVEHILQDQIGYMWFGTRNGLVKYDGINVEIFQLPVIDSTRQDKNRPVVVTALSEAANGDIWVGSSNGEVARFNREKNRLVPLDIGAEHFNIYKPVPVIAKSHYEKLDNNLFLEHSTDSLFSQGGIMEIHIRENGNLWIGLFNQSGFFKIVPDTLTYNQKVAGIKEIKWYSFATGIFKNIMGRAKFITEDDKGTLWISGDRGLIEVHPDPFSFKHHQLVPDSNYNVQNSFLKLFYLDSTVVMGSSKSGIIVFDLEYEKVSNYIDDSYGTIKKSYLDDPYIFFKYHKRHPESQIRVAKADCFFYHNPSKTLWSKLKIFQIDKPVYVSFNPHTKQYKKLDVILDLGGKGDKNPDFEYMYLDRSGTIWASNEKGIFKVSPQSVSFEWLKNENEYPNSLIGEKVDGIYKFDKNRYWVATNAGLNLWEKDKKHFKRFPFEKKEPLQKEFKWFPSPKIIYDLELASEEEIWLATNLSLQKFNAQRKEYLLDQIKLQFFNYYLPCYAIEKDNKGNLWLGHQGRLIYFNPKTGENIDYTFPGYHFLNFLSTDITSLLMDADENLWVGTLDKGMFCLNLNKIPMDSRFIPMEAFESFEYEGAQPQIIDYQGNLWATSPASGVIRINLETRKVSQFTSADGIAHDNTFNIVEDDQQRIWIGTFNGLSCFDPATNVFQNYYQSDGLPTNIINGNKSCKADDGILILPSNKGIITFHPDNIIKNQVPPPLVFTAFKVNNEHLPIEENSPLQQHISLTKQITLDHNQNDITIEFAALHFSSPEKNQYAVFMENDEVGWREIGNQHTVTYTNMTPGKYKFHMKAANSDAFWSEKPITLELTILPPWSATWWAYTIYCVSFISIAYTIYRFQLNRKLEKAETDRLLELDEFKSRFYTNITHEFRTPLTLILGMSEELLIWQETQVRQFGLLFRRNAITLLNLINQLLDLSRLRSNSLKLNLIQGDIIKLVKIVLEPFCHEASSKGLQLTFEHHPPQLFMDFDQEKLRQIIYNLVSNAIKFTNQGFIEVQLEKRMKGSQNILFISVEDTGIGIAQDQLKKIFDHFYQSDSSATRKFEGSGIGLALAKELVSLMQGKIMVNSIKSKGSTFMIELPIANKAELTEISPDLIELPTNNELNDFSPALGNGEIGSPEKEYSALIIEDNPDLRDFLALRLKNNFKISKARNGKIGVEKAIKNIPDVIICDVMMPETDGFEVCLQLKQDERTCHVPILFLTAKTEIKDKLNGLKLGADAYLTKPFNKEELLINIEKCINLRLKLRERYVKLAPYHPSVNIVTQLNDNFLIKLNMLIAKNIHNENLSVSFFAEEMALSKSQLYRKLHSITGKSISSYVRFYRFELARKLLKESDKTISEIAFEVGFNSPNYFTRKFHEEFGVTPTESKKLQKR